MININEVNINIYDKLYFIASEKENKLEINVNRFCFNLPKYTGKNILLI